MVQFVFLFGIKMFKKENCVPTKQGIFYGLGLNKNNGPFLGKDIMYNNPISTNLLVSQSRLNVSKKVVETLSRVQSSSKMQSSCQAKTENFTTVFKFCDEELVRCGEVSSALQIQERRFKEEINSLYDKISNTNNQLLESSMPVLKNLMKKVKEVNQSDKAEYYKIQKELQSIEMQKRTLEHMLLNCRMRIDELEKTFGTAGEGMAFQATTINFFE